MAEKSASDLVREWQKRMESLVSSAASAAGHAELPRQLVEPMQRQLELLEQVVERERQLQREVAGRLVAPFDAVFDLLEGSAVTLGKQADALEAAGQALQETARLVKSQAALFERTVGLMREPTELAKAAAGVERRKRAPAKRAPAKKRRKA
jgi:hypothetical protein